MFIELIITLLVATKLKCGHSFSVCDEVDVTILVDVESIINYSDNIIELLSRIALHGTSENAGFSVWIYGNNIPNDMNINLITLSETSEITVRQQEEQKIASTLADKFNDIKNIITNGVNKKSATLLEVFYLAESQAKPKRNHSRTAQVNIKGLGAHDDEDEFIIFNYNSNDNFIDNDKTTICKILKHQKNKKETVHFLLGDSFIDFMYNDHQQLPSISCDNWYKPKIERDTFISFEEMMDDNNNFIGGKLEVIYSITCPSDVDASNDLGPGNYMVLGNHVQWIDYKTVINCFLTDNDGNPQTPDLTDDSYILIKDYINDDNTFKVNDYLLITQQSLTMLLLSAPKCCDLPPLKILNIQDDNDENNDNNYVIRKLYVNVPRSATEYIIKAKLDGSIMPNTDNLCPRNEDIDGHDSKSNQDIDESGYDDILNHLNSNYDNSTTLSPQQPSRRRLLDMSLIGGAKWWSNSWTFTKWYGSLSSQVNYGYHFGFDVRLQIHFDWSLWPWGYIDLHFKIYGFLDARTWLEVKLKFQYVKSFILAQWSKTLAPRIAGVAIVIRPFFVLQLTVKTLPFVINAGIDCEYGRKWGIGYYIKTDSWFSNFRKGPIRYSYETKKGCSKKIQIGEQGNDMANTCDPIDLGFDLSIEPIVGVAVFELVAVWLRLELLMPFRIQVPERDSSICSYNYNSCNSYSLYASFKITKFQLSLYFGYKLDISFWSISGALWSLIWGSTPSKMVINDYTGYRIGGPWQLLGVTKLGCVNLKYIFPYFINNHIADKCCSSAGLIAPIHQIDDHETDIIHINGDYYINIIIFIIIALIATLLIVNILLCVGKGKRYKYKKVSTIYASDDNTDETV